MKDPREYTNWIEWWRQLEPCGALYADVCARLDARDAEIKALKDALEELMAWQNGPPLENYRKPWTRAMNKAESLLGAPTAADTAADMRGELDQWEGK